MTCKSYLRLALYIAIGTLPAIVEWLTLTFDTTPRGILIMLCKAAMTACVTARAYIDTGGVAPRIETSTQPNPENPAL